VPSSHAAHRQAGRTGRIPHFEEFRMNRHTLISTLLMLAMASPGAAFAQGRDDGHGNGRGRAGPSQRDQPQANRGGPPGQRARPAYRAPPHRMIDHGPGYSDYRDSSPGWRRGGRLPPEARGRQYVVEDWRGHHLSAPPRGYHWVQNGGDYLLVAITTGVILQLLLAR
jgi:Ni/Co efflux regulator RcnB